MTGLQDSLGVKATLVALVVMGAVSMAAATIFAANGHWGVSMGFGLVYLVLMVAMIAISSAKRDWRIHARVQ